MRGKISSTTVEFCKKLKCSGYVTSVHNKASGILTLPPQPEILEFVIGS